MNNSLPKEINKFRKRWLFGLISLDYFSEDRRPDLSEYDGKYKYMIYFKIFGVSYNWSIRSNYLYNDLPFIKKD